MRKLILISVLALTSVTAQAGQNRGLLASGEEPNERIESVNPREQKPVAKAGGRQTCQGDFHACETGFQCSDTDLKARATGFQASDTGLKARETGLHASEPDPCKGI